ncbi:uncharacterized protein LOC142532569 isoform X1 [Primulina tabacum]|uniref:uncharacterized protein LOC142532569 isoform X1 n=1 Tax=Primulina tabacum TaxID=48773 RepID=UPI003F5A9CD0
MIREALFGRELSSLPHAKPTPRNASAVFGSGKLNGKFGGRKHVFSCIGFISNVRVLRGEKNEAVLRACSDPPPSEMSPAAGGKMQACRTKESQIS